MIYCFLLKIVHQTNLKPNWQKIVEEENNYINLQQFFEKSLKIL